MMNRIVRRAALGSLLLSFAQVGYADVVIYPQKGQSEKQQSKDKAECSQWATKQTGIDPKALANAAASAPTQPAGPQGHAVRGAARGAAVGAVGGAIGGDTGKGAAIGAGVGAAGGVARKRQAQRDAANAQQQTQAQVKQKLGEFEKAEGVCLSGRGYSVG